MKFVLVENKRQRGFVLVATLWVVVALFVIASGFHYYVDLKLQQAIEIESSTDDLLEQVSLTATAKYLLSTQRVTWGGITTDYEQLSQMPRSVAGNISRTIVGSELFMDGQWYQGLENYCVAVQDRYGLIGVNAASTQSLSSVLQRFTSSSHAESLIDLLRDYTDQNTTTRLKGAEYWDYQNQGIPIPSNYHIRSPSELFRVMGWGEFLSNNKDLQWMNWFSVSRTSRLNPNVIPEALFKHLLGSASDEEALSIKQMRRQEPFRSVDDFQNKTGIELPGSVESYQFMPSEHVQLRLINKQTKQLRVVGLELTPLGLFAPWHQIYQYSINNDQFIEASCQPSRYRLFDPSNTEG